MAVGHSRIFKTPVSRWMGTFFCVSAVAAALTVFAACSSAEKKPPTLDEQIQREVGFHIDDQEACFDAYSKRRPNTYGDLTLKWEITRTGETTQIEVREDLSNLHEKEFRRCMIESIKKIKFPDHPDHPVLVEAYPFHFRK